MLERKSSPRSPSPRSPEVRESLEYYGLLQKRRGGYGKYAIGGLAWQERFVTISKQGLLTYYEEDPYDSSPSGEESKDKPRGKIDLRTAQCEFLKDIRSEVKYKSMFHLKIEQNRSIIR
jgi:hypothetical protein